MTGLSTPLAGLAPDHLTFLTEALATTAALDAAYRLDLFARLDTSPADLPTLAHDCAITERGARLLLTVLGSIGLVEADGDGTYRAAVSGLSRAGSLCAIWQRLSEAIRDGRPALAGDPPARAEALYRDIVPLLATLFASAAERAADHLSATCRRVLDIGAGAAPWSLAIARRHPACRVTAVDLPAVLPATRQAVAAAGLEAQFDYVGGDFFEVDWGAASFDLAIAGNVCHLFGEAANRRLLARLYDALLPGGRVAIVDVLPNEELDGPRSVVFYALGLLLRTGSGQVYPFSAYVGWLREAGYEGVERMDLGGRPPMSLITASRPL